jgi:hypothetical protein
MGGRARHPYLEALQFMVKANADDLEITDNFPHVLHVKLSTLRDRRRKSA